MVARSAKARAASGGQKSLNIMRPTECLSELLNSAKNKKTIYGLVVQLVRMPPCHGGGREFESHPGRHLDCNSDPIR